MKAELKKLKSSVNQARQQLDQTLLNFQHSKLTRLASTLKDVPGASQSVDMILHVGLKVLERAQGVRQSLSAAKKVTGKATTRTKTQIKRIIEGAGGRGTSGVKSGERKGKV